MDVDLHALMTSDECVCGHPWADHVHGAGHQGECSQCGCQSYG